jgi:hypothetical protein
MLLSNVLDQENIDVKPFEVDGIFYFAYYHRKDIKENLVYDKKFSYKKKCQEVE